MHSEVINWEIKAVFPTPCAPTIATRYVDISCGVAGTGGKGESCCNRPGGARLLLRDLLLRKESPLFTTPEITQKRKINK